MLHAPRLFDGTRFHGACRVVIDGASIASVESAASPDPGDENLAGGFLAPGLLDLQVNGYAGVDFAAASEAEFTASLTALARTGTTGCLPTIITAPVADLEASLDRIEASMGSAGARILGAHVEGPFIAERRKGAHRADLMIDPTPADLDRLLAHPALALMTLAPERAGAMEAITRLAEAGVVVSIGHTDATAAQVHDAATAGARMVTHVFNAQRPIGHREPGVPGAALVDERLALGLIADLHHVAADMIRLTFAAAADRVVLVTDALASAGMPPGRYELGGETIVVEEIGEPARRLDGTLSGSGLSLAAAIRNCVDLGIPLEHALRSATSIPANVIARTDVGVLAPGAAADLVWFDDALQVRGVWIAGVRVV
jgi:N-acetylglucosamine-6-phosphate deacetylase